MRASAYRNRADGYLGEVAVWPTGVVWFQDRDLWFLSTGGTLNGKAVLAEGRKVSLPGVPAEYGRLAYGPDKAFYIQRGAVRSLSADLSRRRVADVSDLVPADVVDPAGRPVEVRATLLGLLSPDDPLLRLRYPQAGTRVDRLYSVVRGPLPLRPDWQYAASPSGRVLLAVGPGSRTLAGYDSSSLQPLWTRTFNENGHPVRLGVPRFTPSGRTAYLGVLGRPREQTIVLDAASGRVRTRLALIDSAFVFEDDRHFIYAAYDGPPNPRFDPGDQFPAPDQVDYSNVLVRCSLRAVCEVAARVPAPQKSLVIGNTFLFPPTP